MIAHVRGGGGGVNKIFKKACIYKVWFSLLQNIQEKVKYIVEGGRLQPLLDLFKNGVHISLMCRPPPPLQYCNIINMVKGKGLLCVKSMKVKRVYD